jgi:type VI secretion system protein ImpF
MHPQLLKLRQSGFLYLANDVAFMSRSDLRSPLLPSLLDRLIDHEPDVSTEPDWARSQGLRELKLSVQRDLEALLNTRSVALSRASDRRGGEPDEIEWSILTYGLPDLTSISHGNAKDCERLRKSVEEAVKRFEPRLMDIRVLLGNVGDSNDRRVHFIIDAQLRLSPNPEPVRFDTTVRTESGEYQVKAET